MKTQTAGLNERIKSVMPRCSMINKALLICGIVSSPFYISAIILGAMTWEGYNPVSYTVSELFAIGAPSRQVVVPLLIVYAVLIYAFGLGIWRSAGLNRALRIAGVLIVTKEVLGVVATVFAPMHLRGSEGTLSDTMHGILTIVGVLLCMLPAMGFGAAAFGKRFRMYSIGTILIFLANAIYTFSQIPQISANQATPWAGLTERINIFSYMLWIVVLAIMVLRKQMDSKSLINNEKSIQPETAVERI